jgi:hypothetical protein
MLSSLNLEKVNCSIIKRGHTWICKSSKNY